MNYQRYVLPPGVRVRTTELGDTRGMLIEQKHLTNRLPDIKGVLDGWVPGHGGDVYWVKQDTLEPYACYSFRELEWDGVLAEIHANLIWLWWDVKAWIRTVRVK